MHQDLRVLPTLKLALKQLEIADLQAGSDPDFRDARPVLRELIDFFQSIEVDPESLIQNLQDLILRRKGVLVAAHLSAANVRTILRNKEFENLADEYSNEEMVDWMIDVREEE